MKNACIWIWYTDQYGKHHEAQGKICEMDGKQVYLADFGSAHPFNNFDGFPLAKQVYEALVEKKIRTILYRVKRLGTIYQTTPTTFARKGWLSAFGGHEQFILPVKNWTCRQRIFKESTTLPDLDLDKWLKNEPLKPVFLADGSFVLQ